MLIDEQVENREIAKQYKELLRISYLQLTADDKKLIRLAFNTAVDAHKDQRRKSGEAYIFHPIAVAKIVASEIGLDATSIAAALLHDTVEDTSYTLNDIERLFGSTVAKIVHGLTKISHLKKDTDISLQAENFRKMLLTLNDDIRVIIIKIADRLHNMQTMDAMPDYKQIKIASETLYIYAPLAHRIGMYNIKTELEDLSLKYTEPERFQSIKSKVEESQEEQQEYIHSFSEFLQKSLDREKIKYSIQGRNKSIFSIHRKMQKQSIGYDQVFDKFAIRVVYRSKPKDEKFLAWKIYSIVTDHFVPNPTRLRDWISQPKSNGYESLHITVMGPQKKWVEVQIRSERMHEIAEKGYAAHYRYKQGNEKDSGIDVWLNRLQEVLESKDGNAIDFVENFKLNLYAEEIFVFTPQGELKSLPQGSSALDFAYSIHTEVGGKTRGARVNGKLVPLSRILKSGDSVEIITSAQSKPTANWLDFVITSRARNKIKASLKEEKKKIADEGKEVLLRKLRHLKVAQSERTNKQLVYYFNVNSIRDVYYRVGLGTIDNKKIKDFATSYNNSFINFFKRRLQQYSSPVVKDVDEFVSRYDKLVFGKEREELPYQLAPCCNPIAGDKVFGFVTVNEGIKVHQHNCSNAVSLQSNYAYRIVPAWWIDSSEQEFTAELILSGIDKKGLVNEVTRVISNSLHVDIKKINFFTDEELFQGKITLRVVNKAMLKKLKDKLLKIPGIEKVSRQ